MYKLDKGTECLFREAIIGIPLNHKIVKMDVVESVGVGIWFKSSEGLPDLIIETRSEDEAIACMKGFNRERQKSRMKIITKEN